MPRKSARKSANKDERKILNEDPEEKDAKFYYIKMSPARKQELLQRCENFVLEMTKFDEDVSDGKWFVTRSDLQVSCIYKKQIITHTLNCCALFFDDLC